MLKLMGSMCPQEERKVHTHYIFVSNDGSSHEKAKSSIQLGRGISHPMTCTARHLNSDRI